MNWKVLYVASRSEKKVNERLTELGLECYVPLKKEKKQWSDRKKIVITPLISGYVFVKVTDQNRDTVFRAAGVLQYVRYNGGDALVKNKEIEALRSIEEKGYYVEGSFAKNVEEGDKVLIKHGPFKGFHGVVKNISNEQVYRIMIESIGFSLTIKVPEEILEKQK